VWANSPRNAYGRACECSRGVYEREPGVYECRCRVCEGRREVYNVGCTNVDAGCTNAENTDAGYERGNADMGCLNVGN